MSHPAFPYEVRLPDRPIDRSDRSAYKRWVDKKNEMSIWCSQEIVDHWGEYAGTFLFVFENDMNRFKDHFEIEEISGIIEDTISRNKKFQEERRLRLKRLKELKAPDVIIETEEMISNMTLAEYKIYSQQLEEEDKQIKSEYAKNNLIQKSIVDEIYARESKLEYNYFVYSSDVRLIMAIDPLSFMSKDDYENDLYRIFLEHAKELYRDRFKEHFGVEE
jgi:hypothetical protein